MNQNDSSNIKLTDSYKVNLLLKQFFCLCTKYKFAIINAPNYIRLNINRHYQLIINYYLSQLTEESNIPLEKATGISLNKKSIKLVDVFTNTCIFNCNSINNESELFLYLQHTRDEILLSNHSMNIKQYGQVIEELKSYNVINRYYLDQFMYYCQYFWPIKYDDLYTCNGEYKAKYNKIGEKAAQLRSQNLTNVPEFYNLYYVTYIADVNILLEIKSYLAVPIITLYYKDEIWFQQDVDRNIIDILQDLVLVIQNKKITKTILMLINFLCDFILKEDNINAEFSI